ALAGQIEGQEQEDHASQAVDQSAGPEDPVGTGQPASRGTLVLHQCCSGTTSGSSFWLVSLYSMYFSCDGAPARSLLPGDLNLMARSTENPAARTPRSDRRRRRCPSRRS